MLRHRKLEKGIKGWGSARQAQRWLRGKVRNAETPKSKSILYPFKRGKKLNGLALKILGY